MQLFTANLTPATLLDEVSLAVVGKTVCHGRLLGLPWLSIEVHGV